MQFLRPLSGPLHELMCGQRPRLLIPMNAGENADLDAMARFHGFADSLREEAALFSGIHFNHQS